MSSFSYHPKTKANSTVAIPNTTKSISVVAAATSLASFAGVDQATVDAAELFYIQVGSAGDIKLTYDGTDPTTADAITITASTQVFEVAGKTNVGNIQLARSTVDVDCIIWFERAKRGWSKKPVGNTNQYIIVDGYLLPLFEFFSKYMGMEEDKQEELRRQLIYYCMDIMDNYFNPN